MDSPLILFPLREKIPDIAQPEGILTSPSFCIKKLTSCNIMCLRAGSAAPADEKTAPVPVWRAAAGKCIELYG